MRKPLLVACVLLIAGLALAYLSVVGFEERIEAESTGNVVVFSSAAVAQGAARLSGAFPLKSNTGILFEGLLTGKGGLGPNEVDFKLAVSGHHRRRLFDRRDFFAASENELRRLLRDELIRATGDTGLFVRSIELGYIERDD